MTVPKYGFATTFTHGAGVICPGARRTTYSLPSAEKPPKSLRRIRPSRSAVCSAVSSATLTSCLRADFSSNFGSGVSSGRRPT